MVYESKILMTTIDIMIVFCPVYLSLILVKRRKDLEILGLTMGAILAVVGIGIIAVQYVVDLIVMHFIPISTLAKNFEIMNEMHLSLSWITASAGVACISLGLAYLLNVLIPRASVDVFNMELRVDEKSADLNESKLRFKRAIQDHDEMRIARDSAEDRFYELLNMLPQAVFEVSQSGELIFTNTAASEMFLFTAEDVNGGLNISDYFDPDDKNRGMENFRKILGGAYLGPNEYAMLRKDGSSVSAVVTARSFVRNENLSSVVGVIFDNTERRQIAKELQASKKMLRMVLDTIPVRVFWKDLHSNFLGCNIQFARDAGFESPLQVVGKNDMDISGLGDAERYRNDDLQVMHTGIAKLDYEETRFEHGNIEDQRWLRTSKIPLVDSEDKIFGVLGCYEDITNARRLSQQLEYLANHDELTGLVNRRAFEQRLSRVLDSSSIDNNEHALCYIDLDQFKVVNDTCGHSAGDELLSQLAVVLQNHVRTRDTVARLGGDEFGALMEHCSMDKAQQIANKLRQAVAEFRFSWKGHGFNVGASIGVVSISALTTNLSELLMQADAACYAAKDSGRNRIHVYREDDLELVQRHQGEMQWVSRIHQALEDDKFVLYAQPIVAITNQKQEIRHYEILTRMTSEDGTLILPGAFYPSAERYSLSIRLDRWVVSKSLEWLSFSTERLNRLDVCSINLSGHSLSDENFQSFVSNQLQELKIPASKICFEITETAAISNFTKAIEFITTLKEQGCRFALDDFGSGLSSFAYLKNLPVDYLKIDGMFVMDILDDPIDLAMVRSINEIGQLMGKETIAEFVENDQIKLKLEEIGVNYVQGYAVGVPVAIDEIM